MNVLQSAFILVFTILLAGGCSQRVAEAAPDAKLLAAKSELSQLAEKTVRAGEYGKSTNCNLAPEGLRDTQAFQDFHDSQNTVRAEYKAACLKEVKNQKAERNRHWLTIKEERRRHRLAHRQEVEDRHLAASRVKPSVFRAETELVKRD